MQTYRDLEKSGIIIYYDIPDLYEVFRVSRNHKKKIIFLEYFDHLEFQKNESRKLKTILQLSRNEDWVNIIVVSAESADFFSNVVSFFEIFEQGLLFVRTDVRPLIYNIEGLEENNEDEKIIFKVESHFIKIAGPKRRPKELPPERSTDD